MYDGDFFDPDCECCDDAYEYEQDPADYEDFDPDPEPDCDAYECEPDPADYEDFEPEPDYDAYEYEQDLYEDEESDYYYSPARAALEAEGFIPEGAYIEHEALLNSYMRETGADAAVLAALMHDLEKD